MCIFIKATNILLMASLMAITASSAIATKAFCCKDLILELPFSDFFNEKVRLKQCLTEDS